MNKNIKFLDTTETAFYGPVDTIVVYFKRKCHEQKPRTII